MDSQIPANVVTLPQGFNRLANCRYGPMLYNANDIFVGRSYELYGEYCEAEMELLGPLLGANDIVIDAGANIGALSIFFAKKVGENGLVVAYEPQRIVFQTLCANVALNSLSNVLCMNAAVGEKQGVLHVPPQSYQQQANFGGVELTQADVGEPVQVTTLDSLELPSCRLLKVDVEGMELAVLKGAAGLIGKFKPVLFVENDRVERGAELVRYIDSLGYQMLWHVSPLFSPANFRKNPTNHFANFACFNMLCIHRSQPHKFASMEAVEIPKEGDSSILMPKSVRG